MISPVGYTNYAIPYAGVTAVGTAATAINKVSGVTPIGPKDTLIVGKARSSECQTCKERKYVDQSNEGDVSFKTPSHISPESSFAAVSSHEQEHVSNAISEGSKAGNQLLSSSVTLKMSVCPECGTAYVAGGETRTTIQYNTANPYENSRKSAEGSLLKGINFDAVA
ncbi:MAG: hypothetical protein K0S01_3571 [Herbinix sp.]|jgi:hypothetical protein|nr:hypothetical protein [Herbinix sp.]